METEFRPTRVVEIETKWSKQSEERGAARYLVLPLLKEMAAAARLSGKALALLLLIHHRQRVLKKRQVTLPSSLLAQFGIDRSAKSRGLHHLKEAGLIRVSTTPGHSVLIELA
jgi:DNA-binding MarR family transcriptional regulator